MSPHSWLLAIVAFLLLLAGIATASGRTRRQARPGGRWWGVVLIVVGLVVVWQAWDTANTYVTVLLGLLVIIVVIVSSYRTFRSFARQSH